MEFWGVEVNPGKPLKVTPDEDWLIHISQISLGESKKDQKVESVPVFAKFGDQKFVLGTLSQEKFPQITCDLVFEKEFELSHNWKNGSVYVLGYKAPNVDGEDEEGLYDDSEASDEEELPVTAAENGKAAPAARNAKPAKEIAAKPESKPKTETAEPKKDVKPDSEDDESDEDDDDEDGDDESDSEEEEGMDVDDDDDDSDEDSDEDDDEETPKKAEQSKKRVNESASKTPVPAKKAKAATPQKTDGKKGGHTATPHPAKNAGKTPASAGKTPANAPQTPKSAGQVSCGTCKKSFNSEVALSSHNKAKHSAK